MGPMIPCIDRRHRWRHNLDLHSYTHTSIYTFIYTYYSYTSYMPYYLYTTSNINIKYIPISKHSQYNSKNVDKMYSTTFSLLASVLLRNGDDDDDDDDI